MIPSFSCQHLLAPEACLRPEQLFPEDESYIWLVVSSALTMMLQEILPALAMSAEEKVKPAWRMLEVL
jgi:hypothetical protein